MKYKIIFKTKVWLYPGVKVAWHFVSVPKEFSAEIKTKFGKSTRGWGSLPVEVSIGKTIWNTSIFPDKKSASYILPLKAKVRRGEKIFNGDTISVSITLI
jgi:hypothetical protein